MAQLMRSSCHSAEGLLLTLTLGVTGTGTYVFLPEAQQGVDDSVLIVGCRSDGLGRPQVSLLPSQEGPRGAARTCRVLAASSSTVAVRSPLALVLELMTLPLVPRLSELSPSQKAKRLAVGLKGLKR